MDSQIRGGDLVLRFWTAADAAAINDIAASSSAEFGNWLPGLTSDLADFEALVERVGRLAEAGTAWYYAIEADGVVVGQCGIKVSEGEVAEISYWIRSDRTNEGLATRAVLALCAAAAEHGFQTLIIRCDEGNARSAAIARKAGFTHVRTVDLDPSLPRTDAQTGREMTWHLVVGRSPACA